MRRLHAVISEAVAARLNRSPELAQSTAEELARSLSQPVTRCLTWTRPELPD